MASAKSAISSRAATSKKPSSSQIVHYELRERVDVLSGMALLKGTKCRTLHDEDHATWLGLADTVHVAEYLDGFVTVRYYTDVEQDGFGRMKAQVLAEGKHAVPYVRMKRAFRSHLARQYYWDVDMVNVQPCIFSQILQQHYIQCPLLNKYIENRDACIAEVMDACKVDRKAAKTLFIRLMFFGGVNGWLTDQNDVDASTVPIWIHKLKEEMRQNASKLLQSRDFELLRKHCVTRTIVQDVPSASQKNKTASMMALYLQTCEKNCVCALVDAIHADLRAVGGIIYDGVLVEKDSANDKLDVDTLDKWTMSIRRATGFHVQLDVKPFEPAPEWLESQSTDPPLQKWDDSWMDGTRIMSYVDMKMKWEVRSFKIVRGGNYVREEENDRIVMTEADLQHAYRHLSYDEVSHMDDGAIRVKTKPFITRWIGDKTLRVYKEMVLMPPPLNVPPSFYNIWTPPEVARYQPSKPVDVNSDGVSIYIRLIKTLCGHSEPVSTYILDWLAQLFQEPAKKTGIALILKGEEGVGKNRFTDLLRYMLGEEKFMQTANPGSTLYGRFTRMREGKFLITINEANGADNFSANDLIKDMITSDQFVCEGKGTNAYSMNCFARYVFTTNNDNAVKVNPDSRRYLVLDVSSELRGNTEFFKDLTMCMEDAHTRHEFWTLLMSRDIRGVDWINHRPITTGQQEMAMLNMPYEHQFLKHLVIKNNSSDRMVKSVKALYNEYNEWLIDNNITPKFDLSQLKFAHKLNKLVRNIEKHTGFNGVSKDRNNTDTVYVFDVPLVLNDMRAKGWILHGHGDGCP